MTLSELVRSILDDELGDSLKLVRKSGDNSVAMTIVEGDEGLLLRDAYGSDPVIVGGIFESFEGCDFDGDFNARVFFDSNGKTIDASECECYEKFEFDELIISTEDFE